MNPTEHDDSAGEQRPTFLVPLVILTGATVCAHLAFSLYEGFVLGWPFIPYEPARFTPYYLMRSAFALLVSGLIVWTIASDRTADRGFDPWNIRPLERLLSVGVMVVALAFVCVFLLNPEAFERFAAEDTVLEWASALFALMASALFAADCLRRLSSPSGWRRTLEILITGSLALLFFLIGMEEISWMQRVVGFETPASMIEGNWQDEFNLHNFQTYFAETVYYSSAVGFLILLPLLKEAAPGWALLAPVREFIPSRFVVAASAPISIFNYGHWNILAIQITVMITIFVLLVYAVAAFRRRERPESYLFLFLAVAVATGQAIFLIYGSSVTYVPNTTEYKEFFIALGIACFAFKATTGRRE